ncbi:MAG: phosphatase PAP2 family protein [Gemmatimonadales bacterium]|nr:MAG: phosphatase PAP2 family protein [Gemmatimonadales bacterium]
MAPPRRRGPRPGLETHRNPGGLHAPSPPPRNAPRAPPLRHPAEPPRPPPPGAPVTPTLEAWGLELIAALQSIRTPVVDALAHGASFLGDEPFYLVALPLVYWALHRRLGLELVLLLLVSTWLNSWLKELLDLPRPSPDHVAVLAREDFGGVPSGHAQNAVVIWGWLAWRLGELVPGGRLRWLLPAGGVVLAISVSRLLLGVHFPHDLVAGWFVGALLLAATLWVMGGPEAAPGRTEGRPGFTGGTGAALTVALPILLLGVHSEGTGFAAAATLLGVLPALLVEHRSVRFHHRGPPRQRLLRVAVGLPVAGAIWLGLGAWTGAGAAMADLLRYVLLGGWIVVLAPLLFVHLGMAGRRGPADAG